ncbi:MAG: MFS transporter, partial [Gluconacetobacter diazotrophicus]|nr:MFS transporter [Gluconacetobacter diazotrophicus]
LVLVSAAMFGIYVATSAAWALPAVAAPPQLTASLGAVLNFGGYVGGAIAPTATGFIVAGTGSFRLAFAIGALVALFSAVACVVLIGEAVPSPAPGLSSRREGV